MLKPLRLRVHVSVAIGEKKAFGAIISLSQIRSQRAGVTAPAEIRRNHNYYYN